MPAARDYAVDVGLALQLTNILRDISEDGERDRIYLPAEDLEAFGVPPEDLLRGVYNRRFCALMEFESERARGYYRSAAAKLPREDAASLRPAEVMRRTYEGVLDRIVEERYFVFGRRLGSVARPQGGARGIDVGRVAVAVKPRGRGGGRRLGRPLRRARTRRARRGGSRDREAGDPRRPRLLVPQHAKPGTRSTTASTC